MTMYFFTSLICPYAARNKVQILEKGLDVKILSPGGDEEHKNLNPMKRIPALITENGTLLPESDVIAEYLEDQYPSPSLRPDDSLECARMRLITHIVDLYFFPNFFGLTMRLMASSADSEATDKLITDTDAALEP